MEAKKAKLFKNGASQAVSLLAEFRFEGNEVYIAKNHVTGDVILSSRPGNHAWGDFFRNYIVSKLPMISCRIDP